MDDFEKRYGVTREAHLKKHGDKPVNYKTFMGGLETLVDMIVALEKSDPHALLEAAAMKQLETHALAVRDYTASFLYSRTEPEFAAASKKAIPAWLR